MDDDDPRSLLERHDAQMRMNAQPFLSKIAFSKPLDDDLDDLDDDDDDDDDHESNSDESDDEDRRSIENGEMEGGDKDKVPIEFQRLAISEVASESKEDQECCAKLKQARALRAKYMNAVNKPAENYGGLDRSLYDLQGQGAQAQHRALYAAVSSNDISRATDQLQKSGADPNWLNVEHGRVALHKAAKQGSVEMVRLLLETKGVDVDVNVVEHKGFTPLDRAIQSGHEEVAQMLRKHGAKRGPLELYLAANKGNAAEVKAMLDDEVDLNWVHPVNGRVALHKAAKQGSVEVVKLLLASKWVRVNVQERKGHSPLDRALAKGHTEIASILETAGATHALTGEQALYNAVSTQKTEEVATLLASGANANWQHPQHGR
jgi:ankyrin repeat protein